MPANLTPEYRDAEERFRAATTPEERLDGLRGMLAAIPKHKGTDKLQGDLKRRIRQAKEEIGRQARKRGFAINVEREGAGQVALVGAPNAGKSLLASSLSGVELPVADYPFTTQKPLPAMMPFEDVQVQLVDLPPIARVHVESWVPGIVRNADLVLLVVDLSAPDVLDQVDEPVAVLGESKVRLLDFRCRTDPATSVADKRTWLVGTRLDAPGAPETAEALAELHGQRFGVSAVSSVTRQGVEALRRRVFDLLDVVRVYTKKPHEPPDLEKPFVLPAGATLLDLAHLVHHDVADHLQFARAWGEGKHDGQRIQRDQVLADRDVVEIHA